MKRKIISILLTIIIITMTLPITNITANAKILEDLEDYWQVDENWVGERNPEEFIEYDTVDDYLKAHYKNYENIDKSEITKLIIDYCYGYYSIKDMSGLYNFENLTELAISHAGEEIETIDFSRFTNLKKLDLGSTGQVPIDFSKLANLTYLSIVYYDDFGIDFIVDLRQMSNLRHFDFTYYAPVYEERDLDEIVNDVKNMILPPPGYEVCVNRKYFYF